MTETVCRQETTTEDLDCAEGLDQIELLDKKYGLERQQVFMTEIQFEPMAEVGPECVKTFADLATFGTLMF